MCGTEQASRTCKCSLPSNGPPEFQARGNRSNLSSNSVINLDHGDPTAFESFWEKMGDKCKVVISGAQSMSYFSDVGDLCWFMEPELAEAIKRVHHVVGNAVVDGYHLVVGTGSSQLFQAALYALCPPDAAEPTEVVSAIPYYSSYPALTDFLRSGLYRWGGDSHSFDKDGPYIEVITSPNNPDGTIREPLVNRAGGKLIHDLAYYWPHYTPITAPADHDIMLFTISKGTGHAGSRLGWALVKDRGVAQKMVKYIELNTIGVSKEAQLRAANILKLIGNSYQELKFSNSINFFEHGKSLMEERWKKLREVAKRSEIFSLPEYPREYCCFSRVVTEAHPAFAWLKYNKGTEDCESFLRGKKILTRNGKRFGTDPTYVRVSMVDRDNVFNLFLERLSACVADNS